MTNWFARILMTIPPLSVYLLVFLFCSPAYADSADVIKQINLLEDDYRTLSDDFYQLSSTASNDKLKVINDIDQLYVVVNKIASQHPIVAIQLLHLNRNTIEDNLDHKAIFTFIALLLKNNDWHLGNTLLKRIKDEGEKSLFATVHFTFAKYHAARHEWPQVNELLEGMITELAPEDAAYAYLLNGSALQHLKKHRQAIDNYNRIPASSRYYVYAQLNRAIANIRQDWWSDAQTTINVVIKNAKIDNSDELTNRLYLTLGYMLLQKEYFRDARDAFGHIGLDSRYTNRALLGIGLTAVSQGDFVGGLNALTILKDKNTFDLSVDESYLLIPYVYEKLQQELTVTASYSEAMNYFQKRMDKLDAISQQHTDFTPTIFDEKTASIHIQNNSLDYGKTYPESFITNYQHLNNLLENTQNNNTRSKIEKLMAKYDATFQIIISELLQQRKKYLQSYLNQSRYGLARMYDKTNEAAQ